MTILGIIAAMVLPRLILSSDTARWKSCIHNRAVINRAVELYYIDTGSWPADDLSDIAADVNYFPEGIPTCPVSSDLYRLDPTTHRVVGHAGSSDHSP